MEIKNPIKMNDWKFGEFLKFVLTVQIALLAIIILDRFGIKIPILRELTALIYLIFIPGILILRILKVHNLDSIETLLYTVGLSVASLLFIGFLMDMIYPLWGIKNPLSVQSSVVTLLIFTIFLCFFSYLRDKNFTNPHLISFKNPFHPQFWFISLIPFLAIFGTYIMNFYGKNILLLILILIIGLIAVLVAFDKIPKKFYPFTVFIIAISILYQASLISPHVWGHDIQGEYQFANLVINNSYWNFKINNPFNTVLSVVILAPIISKVSGMDLTWIFKVIYPFIFSLVPLGLYGVFKKQTTDKIAFFSCFLLISFSGFSYGWMVWAVRQQIAELFFILLIMLILSNIKNSQRNLLLIIFGISLVVSHYTIIFLYIIALSGALIILFLATNNRIKKLVEKFNPITSKNIRSYINSIQVKSETNIINLYWLVFLILVTFLWYGYVGSGLILEQLISVLNLIYPLIEMLGTPIDWFYVLENYFLWILILIILVVSILQILRFCKSKKEHHPYYLDILKDLSVKSRYLTGKKSFKLLILIVLFFLILCGLWISKLKMVVVNEYLVWTVIIFMVMGFVLSIMRIINNKFKKEYNVLSFVFLVILLVVLFIPFLKSLFQIYRIFEISLILLAPFGIIGGIKTFDIIIKTLDNINHGKSCEIPIKLISIFLLIFLLFNSGLTDVIIYGSGPIQFNNHSDTPKFTDAEYLSADWLIQSKKPEITIYADYLGVLLLQELKGAGTLYIQPENLNPGTYTYLRKYNLENDQFVVQENGKIINIKLKARLNSSDKIYDNGYSQIMSQ